MVVTQTCMTQTRMGQKACKRLSNLVSRIKNPKRGVLNANKDLERENFGDLGIQAVPTQWAIVWKATCQDGKS